MNVRDSLNARRIGSTGNNPNRIHSRFGFHRLSGDRKGKYALPVTGNYRLIPDDGSRA